MAWWIDPRHAEESSPLHPTKWEAREGARLYLDAEKAERARREMRQGDFVFLYETLKHPDEPSWNGASAIGALVRVDSPVFENPDAHRNARTGRDEQFKVAASWEILLRDWRNGIGIGSLRSVLAWRTPAAPLTLRRIQDAQGRSLRALLEACKLAEGTPEP